MHAAPEESPRKPKRRTINFTMKNTTQSTLKYYWNTSKKYSAYFYLKFLVKAVSIALAIYVQFYYKEFFDLITEFSGEDRMSLWPELLRIFIIVTSFAILIYPGLERVGDWLITHFQAKGMRDLQNVCFVNIHKHQIDFFADSFVGSLVAKAGRFVRGFERLDDMIYFNFWPNILRLLFSVVVLFPLVPLIAIMLLVWAVVYGLVVSFFSLKRRKYEIIRAKEETKSQGLFADGISNAFTIKMFARSLFERKKMFTQTQKENDARMKTWIFGIKQDLLQASLMTLLEAATFWILIQGWINGTVTIGTMVLTQAYLVGIYMNFWNFGQVIKDLYTVFSDAEEMTEIIQKTPTILDPDKPEVCRIHRGMIEFKDVKFEYTKGRPLFENFNFKVKPGEHVGLVGRSGAGKSTITKLLLRFNEIKKGGIFIDGQDITQIRQEDLRSAISYVPQEPLLFHRSLFENIQYGNLKAKKESVVVVSKMAHADEFIRNTTDGYKTLVGERGIKLSGGERQRVAIARAMLKNAPILVLDEATSSLDSVAESLIQQALETLMKNKTTLVVAHRLSTLKKMDRIVLISDGKVLEEGSHKELIQKEGGEYKNLWENQVGGFLEE